MLEERDLARKQKASKKGGRNNILERKLRASRRSFSASLRARNNDDAVMVQGPSQAGREPSEKVQQQRRRGQAGDLRSQAG